ncbi:helix-turn-helix domain-containing protein [Bacteroides thetaiotaomicron]|nr:helix-turn-helix domain-containing protein [Bacteroides thetaiotaomicron]
MSKHITEEQRYAISMMLQIPMSKKAIAEAIGVDKSTVYREIKRNCDARSGTIAWSLAQRKADRRKQQKHRKEVLTPAMRKRIIKLLKKGFSPGADCRQEPLGGNCDGISRNDISLDLGG